MGLRIVSYAHVLYPYSLWGDSIGAQGAQHIGAALAHNSTLQTLK
jgi:hypothetical protein